MEGFLVINKPVGITSFGVIARLRKITGIKKIGHCGTLDPLASGVLICAIGRSATRKIGESINSDKTYIAKIELGKISDTYDGEGIIQKCEYDNEPTRTDIKKVLGNFIGEIKQVPPIYSAKKIKGVPAHRLVRKGKAVEMKPQIVRISNIKIISYKFPIIEIKIDCGSGTYIRSLANDIGKELGTGAYLAGLIRTKVGGKSLRQAVDLDKLNGLNWDKKVF